MNITVDSIYLSNEICRCQANIRYVKESEFKPKEKRDLINSYQKIIDRNRRELGVLSDLNTKE